MLSPPIYSIMAQTCVACSYYWGTVIYQPHRFILMWRRRDCRSCMPSIIRAVRIEIKDLLMIVKGIKRVASSAIYFAYPNKRAKLRSEEHTSELQSRFDLVCRLLLEKKKNKKKQ